MRLDSVLDSFYILSSLLGVTGPQVCPASLSLPPITLEVAGLPALGMPAGVTAFVRVHVVPMDIERVLPNQTVLVEGGRITTLGPADQVQIPAGAVQVDGRGKYLIPGLANMHEHNGRSEYNNDRWFQFLANGVTMLRNPGFGISIIKQRALLKEIPGTPGPYPNIYFPVSTKKMDLVTAHELGLPVAFHHNSDASFGEMLTLGARGSTEHLTEYFDTLRTHFGDRDKEQVAKVPASEIQALVEAAQRAGIWATPTMDCLEERRSPKQVEVARQIIEALQEAGGRLLLGADADFTQPQSAYGELAALVRAGLSPYQALLTGTRNPAQYLGILDSSGTVAVGKQADLVLLSGNPLVDIRHTLEPVGVMIRGHWLDRATLDQRLLAPTDGT